MMDLATIGAAVEGLKIAKDSVTALIAGKVEIESQGKILTALEKLSEAQNTLFIMRDEMFALQDANRKLTIELEKQQLWKSKIESYELIETPGGAIVYSFKGEPKHFACPSCINNFKIEPLQDNRTNSGKFRCVACRAEFGIQVRKRGEIGQAHSNFDPFST